MRSWGILRSSQALSVPFAGMNGLEQSFEAPWGKLSVSDRVLNVLVTHVVLNESGISSAIS